MRDPLPRVQRGLAAALRDRRTQLSAAAFVLTALACYLYVLVGNINNYDNIVCPNETPMMPTVPCTSPYS